MYYEKVTENPHYSSLENGEKPTHECGIGMVYSFAPTVKTQTMIDIGNALQHRGQNGVGISAAYGDFLKRSTADGLLHDAISDLNLSKFDNPNRWMMIHMRYGTQGGYSRKSSTNRGVVPGCQTDTRCSEW